MSNRVNSYFVVVQQGKIGALEKKENASVNAGDGEKKAVGRKESKHVEGSNALASHVAR